LIAGGSRSVLEHAKDDGPLLGTSVAAGRASDAVFHGMGSEPLDEAAYARLSPLNAPMGSGPACPSICRGARCADIPSHPRTSTYGRRSNRTRARCACLAAIAAQAMRTRVTIVAPAVRRLG